MPLGRLWQIRDAILARLSWDHERYVRVVELQTKYLVGAAHDAAGSKVGDRARRAVQFLIGGKQQLRRLARYEDIPSTMGISQAELDAAAARGEQLRAG